jgi:hypothetical protein
MAIVAMMSGCASYAVVQGRNAELDRKAIQLAATPNGATLGIDLLGMKGYMAAWKAEPATMTGATLLDALTVGAAVYGIQQVTTGNEDDKPKMPQIQNNGGTVIVNTGSGDTTYTTTQTGAAE